MSKDKEMSSERFFRDICLPRTIYIPFLLAKVGVFFQSIVRGLKSAASPSRAQAKLCVEAGEVGWQRIEMKEIYQSACEYIGEASVFRLVLEPDIDYVTQVADFLESCDVTHYLYDPRAGRKSGWAAIWQSFRIASLFVEKGIIPITYLTDLSVRIPRAQCAIVSALRGCAVCFIAPTHVAPIFPHSRLLGPSLMPFSLQTKNLLDELIKERTDFTVPKVLFMGALYEPRTTILERIRVLLASRGVNFEVRGREIGAARVSDEVYWRAFCHADVVVTTADQIDQKDADWTHIPQLVYRYLEVLASGAVLVAQDVPCVRRFFIPGEHFISFETPDEAAVLIYDVLQDRERRARIAAAGKRRADVLIESRVFWMSIDSFLSKDSLI